MKRIVALSVAGLVLMASGDAFASRARILTMGQGAAIGVLPNTHGTFYYDDNYNIFYNPSYVNDVKNFAIVEKWNNYGTTGTGAEGGVFTNFGSISAGLFFNRITALEGTYGAGANNATNPAGVSDAELQPIEIFVGGDMGVKWGLGFMYGKAQAAKDRTATEMALSAGAQIEGFEPFARLTFAGKDKTVENVENKFGGFTVGTRYKWGEWIPYAAFVSRNQTLQGQAKQSVNAWGVGIGRTMKATETTSLNYAISYWSGRNRTELGTATSETLGLNRQALPINVSIESQFASWITGRAGLQYFLVDRQGETTNASDVDAALGASFNFDKVSFDWAVGTGSNNPGTENVDNAVFDFTGGLFTAASLSYSW